eukprot:1158820-Pelagomonas_calceolata.AAC.6
MGPGNSGKIASPLDHNPQYQHYWSTDPRDTLFGAHQSSFSSRSSGFSVCHPIYVEDAMTQALRHAIYSAILNTEATATFMFLPVWGHMITNPYSKLITQAAIAAAITHSYSHIASDSLASLHQTRKQLIYPEKHKQHIQGDVLKIISSLISNSQTDICSYKDAIAKYQASQANNNVADTGIPSAGPGGNIFFSLILVRQGREKRTQCWHIHSPYTQS